MYMYIYTYIHIYIPTILFPFHMVSVNIHTLVHVLALVSVYISLSSISMHLLKGHPWLRLQYFDMMLEGETLGGGGGRAGERGGNK